MHEKGIIPDVITYSCMIDGVCSSGRWCDGERLLREMVERKINPDVITFNILVKEGKFFDADELYKEMLRIGVYPNMVTYNSMIEWTLQAKPLR